MTAPAPGQRPATGKAYLDHNATSPLRPEAREAWLSVHASCPGNPSSVHGAGRRARDVIDTSRERVAAALGVDLEEVVFTSGGTEGLNLALRGAAHARGPGSILVTTAIEHSAVLETAKALAEGGHPVQIVPCDGQALVRVEDVMAAVEAHHADMVCVQAANNEVGTLGPVPALGAALASRPRERRPILICDAVQALGRVPFDPISRAVDLAILSAHKVGGPPGVGVLVRRRGTPLSAQIVGGSQEGDLRAGTENAAGIAAAAVAIELAVREQSTFATRARAQILLLWRELSLHLPDLHLNGPPLDAHTRLPNTLNLSLQGTDGKVLVTQLDLAGLQASAGSACASGSVEPSHVLRAMGREDDDARSALRLSVGWCTTDDECRAASHIMRKLFAASRTTCDGADAL